MNKKKKMSQVSQEQLKVEAGDLVRTITHDPDATYLEFTVTEIVNFHGAIMADSEKYGQINVDLLTVVRKGVSNA